MTIRTLTAAVVVAASLAMPVPGRAAADALSLTPRNDAAHAVQWNGIATMTPAGIGVAALTNASATLGARDVTFVPRLGSAREARATLWVHWDTPEDLAVTVFDSKRTVVGSSDNAPGADEIVSLVVRNSATYSVHVIAKAGAGTPLQPEYTASLWVRTVRGTNFTGPGKLAYVKPNVCGNPRNERLTDGKTRADGDPLPACFFKLSIPINIVFVGFDQAEVDNETNEMLAQLPRTPDQNDPQPFRPVVADESKLGGQGFLAREGGTQVRQTVFVQGSNITFQPFVYQYNFNVITASESYSRALFAAAKAATTSGEFADQADRAYLERYNATAAALRRDHPVLPNSPVDFIDAMKLEDWIAAHPPKGVGTFSVSKPASGYTYFVIDSYRSSYAGQYFNLSHYHDFRVISSRTVDPDTGAQRGFDWGRTWGGRYRFLMLDVGAAPNGRESQTWRGAGDSNVADPPVWTYAACAGPVDCRDLVPLFYDHIGEDVLFAMYMRFTRAYPIRPVAADRYLIASNTWHDADAYTPWPSRLDRLYNASAVARQIRGLLSFAPVGATSAQKYLSASDPEQAVLASSRARVPAPGSAPTQPLMRFVEGHRASYAPLPTGTATIPVINAVFGGHKTWDGLVSDAGYVPFEGADPFGVVQSLDDSTKSPAATATVKDSSGATHSAATDPRPSGTGFTAGAVRGIARMLGLYGPTEGVAYAVTLPPDPSTPVPHAARSDAQYRAYYTTFDPMYQTTATPLSTAFSYDRFEILDRDAISIGVSMEWLDAALDEVADSFAALDSKGYTAVPDGVSKAIMRAGKELGLCVGDLQIGLYEGAVPHCRAAKVAMAGALVAAARTRAAGEISRAAVPAPSTRGAGADSAPTAEVRVIARRPAPVPWLPVGGMLAGTVLTLVVTRPRRRARVIAHPGRPVVAQRVFSRGVVAQREVRTKTASEGRR